MAENRIFEENGPGGGAVETAGGPKLGNNERSANDKSHHKYEAS